MAAIEEQHTRTAPSHTLIAQRYELGRPLTHSGMASVWRGWDRRLCRPVAIKTLRVEDLSDTTAYTRLRREGLVTAALSHPHIVEVHDMIEEDGLPYLIMELVDGDDLKKRIYQRGALNPLDALDIASQICQALQVTHLRSVIHRDIKPHNILLTQGMNAKLTDFGLALSPLDTEPEDTSVVFGTPEYMAPEQAMGERITPATDIYGLGVTLYEALSGDAPFRGPSAEETMKRQIATPVTPLRRLRPDVPAGVEAAVMRALEKDPTRRFTSAQNMAEALSEATHDARVNRKLIAIPTSLPITDASLALPMPAFTDGMEPVGALADVDTWEATPLAKWGSALPAEFWIRLMWAVFALNIMLAISLIIAFLLHLTM